MKIFKTRYLSLVFILSGLVFQPMFAPDKFNIEDSSSIKNRVLTDLQLGSNLENSWDQYKRIFHTNFNKAWGKVLKPVLVPAGFAFLGTFFPAAIFAALSYFFQAKTKTKDLKWGSTPMVLRYLGITVSLIAPFVLFLFQKQALKNADMRFAIEKYFENWVNNPHAELVPPELRKTISEMYETWKIKRSISRSDASNYIYKILPAFKKIRNFIINDKFKSECKPGPAKKALSLFVNIMTPALISASMIAMFFIPRGSSSIFSTFFRSIGIGTAEIKELKKEKDSWKEALKATWNDKISPVMENEIKNYFDIKRYYNSGLFNWNGTRLARSGLSKEEIQEQKNHLEHLKQNMVGNNPQETRKNKAEIRHLDNLLHGNNLLPTINYWEEAFNNYNTENYIASYFSDNNEDDYSYDADEYSDSNMVDMMMGNDSDDDEYSDEDRHKEEEELDDGDEYSDDEEEEEEEEEELDDGEDDDEKEEDSEEEEDKREKSSSSSSESEEIIDIEEKDKPQSKKQEDESSGKRKKIVWCDSEEERSRKEAEYEEKRNKPSELETWVKDKAKYVWDKGAAFANLGFDSRTVAVDYLKGDRTRDIQEKILEKNNSPEKQKALDKLFGTGNQAKHLGFAPDEKPESDKQQYNRIVEIAKKTQRNHLQSFYMDNNFDEFGERRRNGKDDDDIDNIMDTYGNDKEYE